MAEKKRKMKFWFTRRGERVRGPFPAGLISRYIVLGRIHGDDELSNDRVNWMHYSKVRKVMPPRYVNLGNPEEQQEVRMVRAREDERSGIDRRTGKLERPQDRRGSDRRGPESRDAISHRQHRREAFKGSKKTSKLAYALRVLVLILFLGSLVATVLYLDSGEGVSIATCSAPASPKVNWSNCQLGGISLAGADLSKSKLRSTQLPNANFQGANLSQGDLSYINLYLANLRSANLSKSKLLGANLRGVNLQGADLTEADLSYSDLRGANLKAAKLKGAKLAKTIWFDGKICGPTSVGSCQP